MNRVLLVDDEAQVLNGVKRSFRDKRGEWEMLFAGSGEQALAVLDDVPVDVMVTDIRMPGMQGDRLIQLVHDSHSETATIALSGQCSESQALEIASQGVRYLRKPCDPATLFAAITQAAVRHVAVASAAAPDGNDDDLRRMILLLAEGMVRSGLIDANDMPPSFRGLMCEAMAAACVGEAVAPDDVGGGPQQNGGPDDGFDDLRRRLGFAAGGPMLI
ncbi:MAG: response regulator [Rhodospirillaceae bacterium]